MGCGPASWWLSKGVFEAQHGLSFAEWPYVFFFILVLWLGQRGEFLSSSCLISEEQHGALRSWKLLVQIFKLFWAKSWFFLFLAAATVCWGGEAGGDAHRGGRAPPRVGHRGVRGTEVLRQQDRLLQGELVQLHRLHGFCSCTHPGFTRWWILKLRGSEFLKGGCKGPSASGAAWYSPYTELQSLS